MHNKLRPNDLMDLRIKAGYADEVVLERQVFEELLRNHPNYAEHDKARYACSG